jgi:hypothetical protein
MFDQTNPSEISEEGRQVAGVYLQVILKCSQGLELLVTER